MHCDEGDAQYRAFSVLLSTYCSERTYLFKIDRSAFFPRPNVDGAMVHFRLKPASEALPSGISHKAFAGFVTRWVANGDRDGLRSFCCSNSGGCICRCFSRRRKMVKNNLCGNPYDEESVLAALDSAGLDHAVRPQDMSAQEFMQVLQHLQMLSSMSNQQS